MRKSEQLSSATNTPPFLKDNNSEIVKRIDSEMADKLQCLVRCKPKCLKCKLRKHCTNPFFILLLMNIYTHMKLTIRWAEHLLIPETNIRPHTPLYSYETKHTSNCALRENSLEYRGVFRSMITIYVVTGMFKYAQIRLIWSWC